MVRDGINKLKEEKKDDKWELYISLMKTQTNRCNTTEENWGTQ